jgi:hypothetical protein
MGDPMLPSLIAFRFVALITAGLLLPFAASLAQTTYTTAQLQALAAQDATAAEVPVNLFLAQIQAESGFNPSAINTRSGATGIAQALPATAADPGYGIAPFDPTDPVASLAFAAQYDAALYAANGDSWTAALTAYSGGLTPANPGDYGAVFADATAADAGGVGAAGAGPGAATAANAGPAPPPAAGAPGTALPFEWVYNKLINGIIGTVDQNIANSQIMIRGLFASLLTLMMMVYAYNAWIGKIPSALFWAFVFRSLFVWAFIQPQSPFYTDWIEAFVLGLPGYIGQFFSPTANGAMPAQVFDGTLNGVWADCLAVWHATPFYGKLLVGLLIFGTMVASIYALLVVFIVYLAANFLLLLLLSIGPVVIVAGLFPRLDKWLTGYIDVMATLALLLLVADVIVSFFDTTITAWVPQFTPSGSPNTDSVGLLGIAIVLGAMGYVVHHHAAPVVSRIGGGVSLGFDRAASYVTGAASAGGKAATGVPRFLL